MKFKIFSQNKGITAAVTAAFVIVLWYIFQLVNMPAVFALSSAVVVIVAGCLITLGDREESEVKGNEMSAIKEELIEKLDLNNRDIFAFKTEMLDMFGSHFKDVMATIEENSLNINNKLVHIENNLKATADKLESVAIVTATNADKKLADVKIEMINAVNDSRTNIAKLISENRIASDAKAEQIKSGIKKATDIIEEMIEITDSQVEQIVPTLTTVMHKNKKEQSATLVKMNESLGGVASSFENAVEAYQEMENRMALLEQQNIHLQLLTTAIGTVRADIAAINAVKGFVEEHKAGRKIRIVRDDEHGVVVENLMNSDGIGIEKSKMFRGKQLAFEAEFDSSGKMKLSRSYDKNGGIATEVTYSSNGQIVTKLLKAAKNKVADAVSHFKK